MPKSERDWLSDLNSPDKAIQSKAVASLTDFMRRTLAKGFGRNLSDADLEELSHESVARAHEKQEMFRGESKFTTWAAAIAVNLALGELRRRKYQAISIEEAVNSGRERLQLPEAPAQLRRQELMSALHRAIGESLTGNQQEALHAKLSGMPMSEIARRLQTTRGALYKLLHDARQRMRKHLEAEGFHSWDPDSMHEGMMS